MDSSRKQIKRCIRCGKVLHHYHYMVANNGEYGYVCADDRLCGPWRNISYHKQQRRDKNKVLAKIKSKWSEV
ncbi:MAG: hypothetical protein ACI3WU_05750 [Phascolarctobacterium sp.]